jgi:hypothetical protein
VFTEVSIFVDFSVEGFVSVGKVSLSGFFLDRCGHSQFDVLSLVFDEQDAPFFAGCSIF